MQFEVEMVKEALGLGKDALMMAVAVIGIYSSIAPRNGARAPDAGGGLKLGLEIPGIGALFWKRAA